MSFLFKTAKVIAAATAAATTMAVTASQSKANKAPAKPPFLLGKGCVSFQSLQLVNTKFPKIAQNEQLCSSLPSAFTYPKFHK